MKLAKFLDKYDTVIFDMDGVITSEQNYWNCAALTVWEYLNYNSGQKINAKECMQNISKILRVIFDLEYAVVCNILKMLSNILRILLTIGYLSATM